MTTEPHLLLIRHTVQPIENSTLGSLYLGTDMVCYTLEDLDRRLELHQEAKVAKQTAIPRGTYTLQLSYSYRFKKMMPEVLNVPGFSGIRIHKGNTDADTEGCILVGMVRTSTGIALCQQAIERVTAIIKEKKGITLTIY